MKNQKLTLLKKYFTVLFCILYLLTSSVNLQVFAAQDFILDPNNVSHVYWIFDKKDWVTGSGSPYHLGDDYYADDWSNGNNTEGEAAYAMAPGTVIYQGIESDWAYGYHVIVQCEDNPAFAYLYAHMRKDIPVEVGQKVNRSTVLGYVSNTTYEKDPLNMKPHLHCALYGNLDDNGLKNLRQGFSPSAYINGSPNAPSKYAVKFFNDAIDTPQNTSIGITPENPTEGETVIVDATAELPYANVGVTAIGPKTVEGSFVKIIYNTGNKVGYTWRFKLDGLTAGKYTVRFTADNHSTLVCETGMTVLPVPERTLTPTNTPVSSTFTPVPTHVPTPAQTPGNSGTYFGLDTYGYDESNMTYLKNNYPFTFTGFYLSSPSHPEQSWMNARQSLINQGWKIAVIYCGQQSGFPEDLLTPEQGSTDALDAGLKANTAGFQAGSYIYLDIEGGGLMPSNLIDYVKSWVSTVKNNTVYKPAIYCSFWQTADQIRNACGNDQDLRFWVANLNIASTPDFSRPAPHPANSEVSYAGTLQYIQNYNLTNYIKIDINSSIYMDPSSPDAIQPTSTVKPTSTPVPGEVVVDDGDSGFRMFGPSEYWHKQNIGWGNDMYWTYSNGSAVSNYVQWVPTLQGAGNYKVEVYIPQNYATTVSASYKIRAGSATYQATVNQNAYYDNWVTLGTYYFQGLTGSEYVQLDDATGEKIGATWVGFDAVRFIRQVMPTVTSTPTNKPTATPTSNPTATPTKIPDPTSLPGEVVVDDGDSGFRMFGPSEYWHKQNIGWGGDMYWTLSNGSTVSNYVQWVPTLQGAGNYKVEVYIPDNYANTASAKYTIRANSCTYQASVNQSAYYDKWITLGTYYFQGLTGAEYVQLNDVTGEDAGMAWIGFDAVRFTRQTIQPTVTPTATVRPTATATPTPTNRPSPTPAPKEIIIDDGDQGFRLNGPSEYWHRESIGWGSDMYWTYSNGNTVSNYVQWIPNIQSGGNYKVEVYIPGNYANTGTAKYTIRANSSTYQATVNQNIYYNQWVTLGTYYFYGSPGAEYVQLTDVTGEDAGAKWIGFDAVRFSKQTKQTFIEPVYPEIDISTAY